MEQDMSIKMTIEDAARRALKNQEALILSTLRMLLSSLHNREIEKKTRTGSPDLTEEEVLGVIRSEVKKRRDAIVEYEKAGRLDLVEKETQELHILEAYLPPEASSEEIEAAVKDVIGDLGAVSPKDMGRVMGEAMKRIKGGAAGDRVNAVVRRMLGAGV